MKYEEIKDLLNSGFTSDQIIALTTSGAIPSAPVKVPADVPPLPETSESPIKEEAPDPVPDAGASSVGDSNPAPDPAPDPVEELRETVRQLQAENEDLKKQIQTDNIRDRTIKSVSVPDASAMIAEIIRPTYNKK